MEFFKKTAQLFWDESVKAAAVLLVAQHFPALLDRAKATWVVVGSIITHRYHFCDSVNIVKNGHNAQGQQYWCKECNNRPLA